MVVEQDGRLRLLTGSRIVRGDFSHRAGLPQATLAKRDALIASGVLDDRGDYLLVTVDITMDTANSLGVLTVGNMHGPRDSWRTDAGLTLGEYLDDR